MGADSKCQAETGTSLRTQSMTALQSCLSELPRAPHLQAHSCHEQGPLGPPTPFSTPRGPSWTLLPLGSCLFNSLSRTGPGVAREPAQPALGHALSLPHHPHSQQVSKWLCCPPVHGTRGRWRLGEWGGRQGRS